MSSNNFAYFQISIKAIVRKGDDILILLTPDGYFDFPGGRMDKSEAELSLHEVLIRELREEVGNNFRFEIGNIAFISKRQYSNNTDSNNQEYRVLATFFEVDYKSGNVELSNEHAKSAWIKPISILDTPERFISRDEYNQYKNYCELKLSKS